MTLSPSKASLSNRAICSDNVLIQQVGDETVLLDLAGEQYFGLDAVGSRIWQLMKDDANDLAAIAMALNFEFEANLAQIEHDLLVLTNELVAAGLVELR